MRSKLLSIGVVGAALLCGTSASAAELFFQMNPNFDTGGVRQAFIFGAANSTGTVSNGNGFNSAFNLGAQGFTVVSLNVADELVSGVIENKGFKISSDNNLSAYFLNRRDFSTDMSYIIDGAKLGKDYVVAGYQNILQDQMSVQAVTDGTVVTFSPQGAASFDVTLNAGQTYMYTASTNLTGSRIASNQPIAVFSGNNCANVPSGNTACDHLVEQMPSVDLLSEKYLIAKTPRTGALGNVVRVVGTTDGTTVMIDGVLVATLNDGDFYEGRVPGGSEIVASNKVLVVEYLIGQTEAGANTDPAMSIVPGADQWLDSYVFATPSGTADFPTDFVSIIIDSDDIDSLMVDGVAANPALFQPLGTTGFSYGDIDVSGTSGPFSITADNPFQLLLSGFNSFDSYFTYGGAAFSPGASPPPPPPDPNPIPEPATWALMIGGFGLVGGIMRYRRRTTVSYA